MANENQLKSKLHEFETKFDTAYEDKAVAARGNFFRAFPLNKLKDLTLDEYVIGKGAASFSAFVEAKTRDWANMQGATSYKFGIYFGKTKSDSLKTYRFTKKFGNNSSEAFDNVKAALLSLIETGRSLDFKEIDKNPLSQMFKAKILSLYFPNSFLNICSAEHIKEFAELIGIPEKDHISEYQHLLLKKKVEGGITKEWSNPKFMSYLYWLRESGGVIESTLVTPRNPSKKRKNKVNFDEINADRKRIGELSENFALKWEQDRLIGLGYETLLNRIEDRREIPSYGYDFLSHESSGKERYIEVKSVKQLSGDGCYRFYLSENELSVSKSIECHENYYFYLVFFGSNGEPCEVEPYRAKDFYKTVEVEPCAYIVRFQI